MEIREYLRAKRRWLPALVAAPIVAALATVGVVHLQPPETTARVTAYVPPALTNSDSQIGLYIARLSQGLLLPNVKANIATKAEIDAEDLVSLAVKRSGQSDQFDVTVVTTVPSERAVQVVEAATKVGTAFVARQSLSGADVTTEISRQNFIKAQNDLFAYQDEIRDLDPNITYNNVSRQLIQPDGRSNTSALRTQQGELVKQVRRYNELKATVQTTSGSLGSAQTQSAQRAGEVVAADNGSQILYSGLVPASVPGMRYIEPAGLAVVLAFVAVLGLSLLPDLLRAASGGTAAVASGADGSANPVGVVTVAGPEGEQRLVPPGSAPARATGNSTSTISAPASDAGDSNGARELATKDRA